MARHLRLKVLLITSLTSEALFHATKLSRCVSFEVFGFGYFRRYYRNT